MTPSNLFGRAEHRWWRDFRQNSKKNSPKTPRDSVISLLIHTQRLGVALKCQCSRWTSCYALGCAALKTLSQRTVKRHRHPDIKAPAYKRQPKFLAGFGSNLYAKTTVYTLARLINYIREPAEQTTDARPYTGLVWPHIPEHIVLVYSFRPFGSHNADSEPLLREPAHR